MENNNVKIPTGYLLDKILDLKGKKIGNILINAQNTLVFYAETEVKGQEVYNLVSDVKEKILLLKELLDEGLITQEEYDNKKAALLESL